MKIAICTPTYGDPKASYVKSLADLIPFTMEKRPDIRIRYLASDNHIIAARNLIARAALEVEADFLLWVDADMVFPHSGLLDLLKHNLPVVGCNYSARTAPAQPTARGEGGLIFPDAQKASGRVVEPVETLGLGFCLVSADVMRKLPPRPFRANPKNPHGLGEDIQFFRDIRALGEKVYLDHALSEQIGHVGQHVFTLRDVQPRAHRR